MRLSEQRTTVAVLRAIIGETTHEFARATGLSLSAVEKLESGRLKLSDSIAQRISFETGASTKWLLGGNTRIPPLLDISTPEFLAGQEHLDIATGNADAPLFTADVYRRVRAARLSGQSPTPDGHHSRDEQIICVLLRLLCIYCAARKRGEDAMALFRLDSAEAELAREFGFTLDQPALTIAAGASKAMQKLASRLKRVRAKEGDIDCTPKTANFFSLMKLRRRTAKTMRSVNRPKRKHTRKIAA